MKQTLSGNIIDIHARRIYGGTVTIDDGRIVAVEEDGRTYDRYLAPGLVDAHVHIESSMLTPEEFARTVIAHGTVAVVSDPHEIANVMGPEGISFMEAHARRAAIKIRYTIPSCVPATAFDRSGGRITADDVERMAASGRFVGLSEVMDMPAVLGREPEMMRKLDAARRHGLPVDGHAPGATGEPLRQYIAAGITTDHEAFTLAEAREKLALGMKILIREGSAARNYAALHPVLDTQPDRVMFCMDDAHPHDLLTGHIDKLVRRALADGHDLFDVWRAASLNPVLHYGLPVGLLRPGDPADFCILDNLTDLHTLEVWIDGERRYDAANPPAFRPVVPEPFNRFVRQPIRPADLRKACRGRVRCIGVLPGELVTQDRTLAVAPTDNLEADLSQDLLKIVYLNRYTNDTPPQVAYLTGFGLRRGALAASVSHDSHNIIAIGSNDRDLARAINTVIEHRGGLSFAEGDRTVLQPLPIAGIMADCSAEEIATAWLRLSALRERGCRIDSPFMTLSFIALIVIPELKLGEQGLFQFSRFRFLDEEKAS